MLSPVPTGRSCRGRRALRDLGWGSVRGTEIGAAWGGWGWQHGCWGGALPAHRTQHWEFRHCTPGDLEGWQGTRALSG